MISIKQKELKQLKSGEIKQSDFAQKLAETYPSIELAQSFTELLAMKDAPVATTKISVTKDELDAIVGLFRERGSSPRGRKSKKAE